MLNDLYTTKSIGSFYDAHVIVNSKTAISATTYHFYNAS